MTAYRDLILRHSSPWNRTQIEAFHVKILDRAYLEAAILPRSVLAFWNSAAPAKKVRTRHQCDVCNTYICCAIQTGWRDLYA